ncbi:DUF3784 domain-containing protein [Clostridium sp.]|uniref:DUF3784 domain-containing protein n=1 Tax=Clostridium sp. TaxID=1506 RepID=UPI0039E82FC4
MRMGLYLDFDKLKLCKCIGNLLISFAILFILNFICDKYLKIPHLSAIFIVLILILVFGNLIYINTGNRFIKKE